MRGLQLYICLFQLAYEAFKKAQAYSPECVQAWTGHGLIAERIGNAESMDLFRHATELGYHVSVDSNNRIV